MDTIARSIRASIGHEAAADTGKAHVACSECRRRKTACSRKLPHCTECLTHNRICSYNKDKRRKTDDERTLPLSPPSSTSEVNQPPLQQNTGFDVGFGADRNSNAPLSTTGQGHNSQQMTPSSIQSSSDTPFTAQIDLLSASVPEVFNDNFWWLASQWQNSLPPEIWTQWPETQLVNSDAGSTSEQALTTSPAYLASPDRSQPRTQAASARAAQDRTEEVDELYHAYIKILPNRRRWPRLFKALEDLVKIACGDVQGRSNPFIDLDKLRQMLEQDTPHHDDSTAHDSSDGAAVTNSLTSDAVFLDLNQHRPGNIPPVRRGTSKLRRAWVLAALCLADSSCPPYNNELPPRFGSRLEHSNPLTSLFSVTWTHCRGRLGGDPIELMQIYRMMALAFWRCKNGHELAKTCIFLACRAALGLSLHRAATIRALDSPARQQAALSVFWHVVSHACQITAFEGKDMPMDISLIELPLPDPRLSLELDLASRPAQMTNHTDDLRFYYASSTFMSRIWTNVAVGQTVHRYYRESAEILVPHETRLEVAAPQMFKASLQEHDRIMQTSKALEFCFSLLQSRDPGGDSMSNELKRHFLITGRYSSVLLHYPFCRVDKEHRQATQQSISAILSNVLGFLLDNNDHSAAQDIDESSDNDSSDELPEPRQSRSLRRKRPRTQGDTSSGGRSTGDRLRRHSPAMQASVDESILEMQSLMAIRAFVFSLSLFEHPPLWPGSEHGCGDDSDRQRSDAVLALRAMEQLHGRGSIPRRILREARKLAKKAGII